MATTKQKIIAGVGATVIAGAAIIGIMTNDNPVSPDTFSSGGGETYREIERQFPKNFARKFLKKFEKEQPSFAKIIRMRKSRSGKGFDSYADVPVGNFGKPLSSFLRDAGKFGTIGELYAYAYGHPFIVGGKSFTEQLPRMVSPSTVMFSNRYAEKGFKRNEKR